MTMKTNAKTGRKKAIALAVCVFLLACSIMSAFYLELYGNDLLKEGRKENIIVNKKIDTYNVEINKEVSKVPSYHFSNYNIFSYFTQLSNALVVVWALIYCVALLLNLRLVKKICESPVVVTSLTTYVVIAGGTVAATMILGMVRFQPFTSWSGFLNNWVSISYHFVTPLAMLAFCLFKTKDKSMKLNLTYCVIPFPLAYAIFTIIRGNFIYPGYYPYFIFSPRNIWEIIGGGAPYSPVLSYIVMALMMAVTAVIFWGMGWLIKNLYNVRAVQKTAE